MQVNTIYDDILELVTEHVDECVNANQPNIIWENSGIGAYEYHGAKCFDHGQTYPVIDGDLLETVYIQAPHLSVRLLQKVAADLSRYGFESFTDVRLRGKSRYDDDVIVRCGYKIARSWVEDHSIFSVLEWDEEVDEI